MAMPQVIQNSDDWGTHYEHPNWAVIKRNPAISNRRHSPELPARSATKCGIFLDRSKNRADEVESVRQ